MDNFAMVVGYIFIVTAMLILIPFTVLEAYRRILGAIAKYVDSKNIIEIAKLRKQIEESSKELKIFKGE